MWTASLTEDGWLTIVEIIFWISTAKFANITLENLLFKTHEFGLSHTYLLRRSIA